MRYTRPTIMHFPRRSRAYPMKGKGEDSGKWFKCWNCGFPCNIDREDSSGSAAGNDHTDLSSPSLGFVENGIEDRMITLDFPAQTIMEQDASGTAKTIVHEHQSDVTRGCPFCGATNYRG